MDTLSRHRPCGALLDLDDVKGALGLVEQAAVPGIHPIPVDHVVGTVGRCCDFDRCFHPLRREMYARLRQVRDAFPDGAFPPISVFQIDEVYFVSDGHHRVALARRLGIEFIDADVTRIYGPYRLDHDVVPAQIELTGHERHFLTESGLAPVRPAARITLSSANGYTELLEVVKAHGYDLMRGASRFIAPGELAAHWYDCVYRPTVDMAKTSGLTDLLPSCSEGDLFLGLHRSHLRSFGTECAASEQAIRRAVDTEREQLVDHGRRPGRVFRRRPRGPKSKTLPRR